MKKNKVFFSFKLCWFQKKNCQKIIEIILCHPIDMSTHTSLTKYNQIFILLVCALINIPIGITNFLYLKCILGWLCAFHTFHKLKLLQNNLHTYLSWMTNLLCNTTRISFMCAVMYQIQQLKKFQTNKKN